VQQESHTLSQGDGIVDQVPGLAVDDGLLQATVTPGHDRHPGRHSLERRDPELLAIWGEHGDGCSSIRLCQLR
jgi:hypothetical protein